MNTKYDVIIVGGGPAGGTAAYFLGRAGRRVLVLEKELLPRYKACGGGISAHVLEQFSFSFEAVIESKVKAISYAFAKSPPRSPCPRDNAARFDVLGFNMRHPSSMLIT